MSQQQFTEGLGLYFESEGDEGLRWEDFSYVNVLFKCIFALGRLSPFRN